LANSPQARKRARQSNKRQLHNASQRSALRTSVKKVVKAIAAGDKPAAEAAYRAAVPALDRSATRGVIHRNKAARHKCQLNKDLRAMAG
jgi:small subunit ribosomal protein S20